MIKKSLIILFFFELSFSNNLYYFKNNSKIFLEPTNTTINSRYISNSNTYNTNIDYYKTNNDVILGVSDTILIKVTNENTDISSYLNEFDLSIKSKLGKKIYLLKTKNKSLTIDIANSLYLKENIKYAHPNFLRKRIKR